MSDHESNNGYSTPVFHALVDYEDVYVQPLIISALANRLPKGAYDIISSNSLEPTESKSGLLEIRAYESLDFEGALKAPATHLVNAYIIRKALIRKHYLSNTVSSWLVKCPQSILQSHVKPTVDFELDYAEFLDDALVEAFELRASSQANEGKAPAEREWWILKPSMSDQGQGIRLFSTEKDLQAIFDEWETDMPSDSEDAAEETTQDVSSKATTPRKEEGDYIITSQLRHFVAQPYIHPPLLLPSAEGRKFHIRTYVLAVGALRVYVYKPMLALFAAEPYAPPWSNLDRRSHLTNTCLLETGEREGSVRPFWELDDDVPGLKSTGHSGSWKDKVVAQICAVTGAVFEAAARGQVVYFQPLPNAFEVFGLDFLVDAQGHTWFLEANAFPDFKQTGKELEVLVQELFEDVVDVAIKPFFGIGGCPDGTERMVKVLDLDLGRR